MVLTCKHILLSLIIILNIINMEVWKPIKGFDRQYEISNQGNLRSVDRYVKHYKGGFRLYKGKPKNIRFDKDGYFRCNLKNDGKRYDFRISRLVADAFVPNPNKYLHVNHKNGIKSDNRVSNLEWCTQSENSLHAVKVRLIKTKLTDKQALEIFNSKNAMRKIAREYKISQSVVWKIKNKKAYKHLFT